jgi:hypothetical protein
MYGKNEESSTFAEGARTDAARTGSHCEYPDFRVVALQNSGDVKSVHEYLYVENTG